MPVRSHDVWAVSDPLQMRQNGTLGPWAKQRGFQQYSDKTSSPLVSARLAKVSTEDKSNNQMTCW